MSSPFPWSSTPIGHLAPQPELVSDASLRRQSQSDSTTESIEKERVSTPNETLDKEQQTLAREVAKDEEEVEEDRKRRDEFYRKYRPYILAGTAAVILGWWISSTVLHKTRHRWVVQTVFAWFFLLVIAFRFIPNRVITKPVGKVWNTFVQEPWYRLPYKVRLAIGWLALLAVVFGSAFGFELQNDTNYGDRAISVLGLFVFQLGFYLTSRNRNEIPWPTVIVGLFLQQVIAMFVLKSGAGFEIFSWIAALASDFLNQSHAGAALFFSDEVVAMNFIFVNTLAAIIFFVAFVQMMYYIGVMQWILKKFAWFFFKLMNVSGAEAVVAASSPWIGQGESACLVRPYVDLMTESEIHLIMTSGFAAIAGSVMSAYIALGVPAQNIVTSSVMSIPASMAISKIRVPELEEPVTRGRVIVDRGEKNPPANALHAFSKGSTFGLIVAGSVLTNVLTIISLVAAINGLLTWIGSGFGFNQLTIQLILRYIFYPISFFLGVPRNEILQVSELLATKLVANEFAAYLDLQAIMQSDNPLSQRGFHIASYALCGFANLGSVGIQIGVLGALAPSRSKVIARIALSAMACGFISTLQTAGIAGMLI